MGNDDAGLLEMRHVDRLFVAEEVVHHAPGDITEVRHALAKVIIRQRFKRPGESLGHDMEGPFRRHLLVGDHAGDAFEQGRIVKHQQMRLEDAGILGPHRLRHLLLDVVKLLPCREQALLKPFKLAWHVRLGNLLSVDLGALLAQYEDLAHAHPRRDGDAAKCGFTRSVALWHGLPIAEASGFGNSKVRWNAKFA